MSVLCMSVGGENKTSEYANLILNMNTFSLGLALKAETDSGWYIYWAVSVIPGDNFLIKIGVNTSVLHFSCASAGSTACWQTCVERLVHNLSCDPQQITDHKNVYFRLISVKRAAIIYMKVYWCLHCYGPMIAAVQASLFKENMKPNDKCVFQVSLLFC